MSTLTPDDMLRATLRGLCRKIKCENCLGSGTKFSKGLKSRMCPVCRGVGQVVEIPRKPAILPITADWRDYFERRGIK